MFGVGFQLENMNLGRVLIQKVPISHVRLKANLIVNYPISGFMVPARPKLGKKLAYLSSIKQTI